MSRGLADGGVHDTAEAARYAQLAECNTAACAYFELATYLKD